MLSLDNAYAEDDCAPSTSAYGEAWPSRGRDAVVDYVAELKSTG